MKYLYILLICLILFYLISRYFEKYYSQENFDPSLVPVSSIITLAKVAQKIVDGNGTLTNPANLNIGTPTGKGNLLVTGNSTTNGNKQIDGTLGVTGATTVGGTLGVTGKTTVGGTLGVTGATTVGGTLGVTGATTVGGTLGVTGATTLTGATNIGATSTAAATTSLTVNGSTAITGNTKIDGVTTFATGAWHKSSDGANRLNYNNNGWTAFGAPDGWFFQNAAGTNVASIDKSGNMTINGTLTINGTTLTTNSSGQLVISKPIVNTSPEFNAPVISGANFKGNQRWEVTGNGNSDNFFEFRDSATNARRGWMGWTSNGRNGEAGYGQN